MAGSKQMPTYPDERLGNFVRGLVLGALAGGLVALFQARRSGSEARADLRLLLDGLTEQLADLSSEARSAVNDFSAWASDAERPQPAAPPTGLEQLSLLDQSPPTPGQMPTGPLPRLTRSES